MTKKKTEFLWHIRNNTNTGNTDTLLGREIAWCATEVDSDGVMVPGKTGACEDERNTAYAGPGKDAQKFIFFC